MTWFGQCSGPEDCVPAFFCDTTSLVCAPCESICNRKYVKKTGRQYCEDICGHDYVPIIDDSPPSPTETPTYTTTTTPSQALSTWTHAPRDPSEHADSPGILGGLDDSTATSTTKPYTANSVKVEDLKTDSYYKDEENRLIVICSAAVILVLILVIVVVLRHAVKRYVKDCYTKCPIIRIERRSQGGHHQDTSSECVIDVDDVHEEDSFITRPTRVRNVSTCTGSSGFSEISHNDTSVLDTHKQERPVRTRTTSTGTQSSGFSHASENTEELCLLQNDKPRAVSHRSASSGTESSEFSDMSTDCSDRADSLDQLNGDLYHRNTGTNGVCSGATRYVRTDNTDSFTDRMGRSPSHQSTGTQSSESPYLQATSVKGESLKGRDNGNVSVNARPVNEQGTQTTNMCTAACQTDELVDIQRDGLHIIKEEA